MLIIPLSHLIKIHSTFYFNDIFKFEEHIYSYKQFDNIWITLCSDHHQQLTSQPKSTLILNNSKQGHQVSINYQFVEHLLWNHSLKTNQSLQGNPGNRLKLKAIRTLINKQIVSNIRLIFYKGWTNPSKGRMFISRNSFSSIQLRMGK